MITRFGSLYAGNIDMEDVGLDGTPVNDRWYSDSRLAGVFEKSEKMIRLMDDLGYDTFWAAEHHFQREGYECIPNLLMLYVHMAQVTKQIKFGCGFNINPMWHPLRLAEDYATADHLTNGRIIFGVGRGYHSREVETFGSPILDQQANRELFEEQVEVLFKAFNEKSFSHEGKHYTLPPEVPYRGYDLKEITLVPRPKYLPVECYQPIVSASQRAMDFMVKYGIKGIVGGGAAIGGASDDVVDRWRTTLANAGVETERGGRLIISFSIFMANSREEAMDQGRKIFQENMKMFGPLGFVAGLTPEQIAAMGDRRRAPVAGLPTIEDAVEQGQWIIGPPDQIIEEIESIQKRFPGLEELNIGVTSMGSPLSLSLEQLEWFGKDVMPHFKK